MTGASVCQGGEAFGLSTVCVPWHVGDQSTMPVI